MMEEWHFQILSNLLSDSLLEKIMANTWSNRHLSQRLWIQSLSNILSKPEECSTNTTSTTLEELTKRSSVKWWLTPTQRWTFNFNQPSRILTRIWTWSTLIKMELFPLKNMNNLC
jgi:hypothetical protein